MQRAGFGVGIADGGDDRTPVVPERASLEVDLVAVDLLADEPCARGLEDDGFVQSRGGDRENAGRGEHRQDHPDRRDARGFDRDPFESAARGREGEEGRDEARDRQQVDEIGRGEAVPEGE